MCGIIFATVWLTVRLTNRQVSLSNLFPHFVGVFRSPLRTYRSGFPTLWGCSGRLYEFYCI